MKVVVTGASGLVGWHVAVHLHARNCAARFRADPEPFDLVLLNHKDFADRDVLCEAVNHAHAVIHCAGVNRVQEGEVTESNPEIAEYLISACRVVGAKPHVVYTNSVHSASESPYGQSKRIAGELLAASGLRYTDIVLPHIFGEFARPYYNNVTATLIDQIISGSPPTVNGDGRVELLSAGDAAEVAIMAVLNEVVGEVRPVAHGCTVPELLSRLQALHQAYSSDSFPALGDPVDLALFNSYRTALYPDGFPREIRLISDSRGTLFEAVKGGGDGQVFLSWTEPNATRGNHFHLRKVERFVVLQGEAIIRMRRVLDNRVWEYRVKGESPASVDIPTLHTHCIQNVGTRPLLTLFWTHECFDKSSPDTYFDPVSHP